MCYDNELCGNAAARDGAADLDADVVLLVGAERAGGVGALALVAGVEDRVVALEVVEDDLELGGGREEPDAEDAGAVLFAVGGDGGDAEDVGDAGRSAGECELETDAVVGCGLDGRGDDPVF